MRLFWNLLLALFWSTLWGPVNLPSLSVGFVLGYIVLMGLEITGGIENHYYGRKVWRLTKFFFFFLKELWVSNLTVATDVLRIRPKFRPAIIKIPLDITDDTQITLLANVITLTPGTLTLDVAPDKKHIYVHAMFYDPSQREDFINGIKVGFEKKIKEIFAT